MSFSVLQVGASGARRLAPDLEVLGHREVGEDAPVLGHVAEAESRDLVRRAPVDARASKRTSPSALDEAHQRLERSRLAGAVAAERATTSPLSTARSRPKQNCARP
jgi:hypothetical protein